jgi:hypothetical protein
MITTSKLEEVRAPMLKFVITGGRLLTVTEWVGGGDGVISIPPLSRVTLIRITPATVPA